MKRKTITEGVYATGLEIALRIVGFLIVIVGDVSGVISIRLTFKYFRYNRRFKKVRLRGLIRNETSLTSMGMGAQKAALAIPDKEGDEDMQKSTRLVPLVTFGLFAFIPLVVIGELLVVFVLNSNGICTMVLGVIGFCSTCTPSCCPS